MAKKYAYESGAGDGAQAILEVPNGYEAPQQIQLAWPGQGLGEIFYLEGEVDDD